MLPYPVPATDQHHQHHQSSYIETSAPGHGRLPPPFPSSQHPTHTLPPPLPFSNQTSHASQPSSSNRLSLPLPFPQQPAPTSSAPYGTHTHQSPYDYHRTGYGSSVPQYSQPQHQQHQYYDYSNYGQPRSSALPIPHPYPQANGNQAHQQHRLPLPDINSYASMEQARPPFEHTAAFQYRNDSRTPHVTSTISEMPQPNYSLPPPQAPLPAPTTNQSSNLSINEPNTRRKLSIPISNGASITPPTLSPESSIRSEPPPPPPPPLPRAPFQTTKTVPYVLPTNHGTEPTCPPPKTSKYHDAQKSFLSNLYLKDDPNVCLQPLFACVRKEEHREGGILISQLINLPLLGTTETCLHMAVKWCKPMTVKALLRIGGNGRLRTGYTCREFPCTASSSSSSHYGHQKKGSGSISAAASATSPPPEFSVTSSGRVTRKRKVNYSESALAGTKESQEKDDFLSEDRLSCTGCYRIVLKGGAQNSSGLIPGLSALHIMALYPTEWVEVDSHLFRGVIQGLWGAFLERDLMGQTCMHLAISKARRDSNGYICGYLDSLIDAVEELDSDMSPNKRVLRKLIDAADCEGNTALHLACSAGDLESVKVLVRASSNCGEDSTVGGVVGLANTYSQSPFDVILELAWENVLKLGLYEDELATCLKDLKYVDDEDFFRRALVGKFQQTGKVGSKEDLQFRLRRMMLLEGIDGFSIQQLIKFREIALVVLKSSDRVDEEGQAAIGTLFDAVLIRRLDGQIQH
ncbi:hypothetical protein BDR26DRAFT_855736, partial [Obelidium mucronatum]